jgi:hypothetical protein
MKEGLEEKSEGKEGRRGGEEGGMREGRGKSKKRYAELERAAGHRTFSDQNG